jgi:hypothetical protein
MMSKKKHRTGFKEILTGITVFATAFFLFVSVCFKTADIFLFQIHNDAWILPNKGTTICKTKLETAANLDKIRFGFFGFQFGTVNRESIDFHNGFRRHHPMVTGLNQNLKSPNLITQTVHRHCHGYSAEHPTRTVCPDCQPNTHVPNAYVSGKHETVPQMTPGGSIPNYV